MIVHLLNTKTPKELGLPYPLWNREAVAELIKVKFGITRSVWTIGRYLKAWGFTLQVAVKKAYEQDPEEVKRWLEQEYPQIKAAAAKEGAVIYWLDEMGISSSDSGGRSYGKKGKTPVVKTPGRKYKFNVLSSIDEEGELHFKLEERIHLFFLPAYSPELNPVELLNQDTKANAAKKKLHRWLKDLTENIYQYLINRPAQVIKNYFLHPLVNYIVS